MSHIHALAQQATTVPKLPLRRGALAAFPPPANIIRQAGQNGLASCRCGVAASCGEIGGHGWVG